MKYTRFVLAVAYLFALALGLSTAAPPPPTAHAQPNLPATLSTAEWNQIQALLEPMASPTWEEQAKLLPNDAATDQRFGFTVAVSGNTAVIGARGDSGYKGAAYVFVRQNGVWSQQAKLTASDGAAIDVFGESVAISGDTAIIGAPQDDDGGNNSGSAYVFIRTGTSWSQQVKLTASDATAGASFGTAIAFEGDTAVIGAPYGSTSGFAYVFTRTGNSWSQQDKLIPSDGVAGDQFGNAVALAGDTAVIGAFGSDTGGTNRGAAYVFVRTGTSWSEQARLTALDGAAGDVFGANVAISGDTAIIGAPFDDHDGIKSGSAYVFTRSGTAWSQQAKLLSNDREANDSFGRGIAILGNTAIITASADDDNGIFSGSAYVFTRHNSVWSQQSKILASDGAAGNEFGYRVAISGNTAVIGAQFHTHNSIQSGAAYVFQLDHTIFLPLIVAATPK